MELGKRALQLVWCHMPIVLALRELRQENCKFEANLGCMVKPCHKTKKKPYITA